MVTLVTVTCDQPTGLRLCEQWMRQQTIPLGSLQWIVVDDGLDAATVTCGQQYIRRARDPQTSGAASLCRNLLAALPEVGGDQVIVIEHDDYYAPTHLEGMLAQLATPGILAAGDDKQRYYHVGARRWKVYQNRGAALCQTGFHRELLPLFHEVIEECLAADVYGVDARFWSRLPADQKLLEHTATVVGIKGLPGRTGLGVGHRPATIARWAPDPTLERLRQWIGDDAAAYAECATPPAAAAAPSAEATPVEAPPAPVVLSPPPPVHAPATVDPAGPPRLVSAYFGAEPQWTRLARVLEASARQHCPSWQIDIRAILPPVDEHGATRAFRDNTQKLDYWRHVVCTAPDGARLALLDIDMLILRPLDPAWEVPFDVAYTTRPPTCRFPFNAGVVFVRVTDRSRRFITTWRDENLKMLRDRAYHAPWKRRYGGINQAALGCVLEQAASDTTIRAIPCAEWNCEDTTWSSFDPAVTRVLHLKSALRRTVFGIGPADRSVAALASLWTQAERAALGAPGA